MPQLLRYGIFVLNTIDHSHQGCRHLQIWVSFRWETSIFDRSFPRIMVVKDDMAE
jgi:hypothetical protein